MIRLYRHEPSGHAHVVMSDSNAILVCLAERHAGLDPWQGVGPEGRACVQRGLSLDQERANAIAERVLSP